MLWQFSAIWHFWHFWHFFGQVLTVLVPSLAILWPNGRISKVSLRLNHKCKKTHYLYIFFGGRGKGELPFLKGTLPCPKPAMARGRHLLPFPSRGGERIAARYAATVSPSPCVASTGSRRTDGEREQRRRRFWHKLSGTESFQGRESSFKSAPFPFESL